MVEKKCLQHNPSLKEVAELRRLEPYQDDDAARCSSVKPMTHISQGCDRSTVCKWPLMAALETLNKW